MSLEAGLKGGRKEVGRREMDEWLEGGTEGAKALRTKVWRDWWGASEITDAS